MHSRRNFIGRVAGGIAGTLAAPEGVLGAGDRVRLGVIGAGERGLRLLMEARGCANTRIAACADVFTERLGQAGAVAPEAKMYPDHRSLLDDPGVDAVLIATPQHLHAAQAADALDAGKHVYVEKAAALTLDDAKTLRAAVARAGRRTVQVGHQFCSSGAMEDALRFLQAGWVGRISAIRAHCWRNTPRGKPPWQRPVTASMTPASIGWEAFLGSAPRREFDAGRFANWRCFADYSAGNLHEGMSQQLAFWYRALELTIPWSVSMSGAIHLWDDGREIPDTMSVAMEHREGLLFTWDSGFGNSELGTGEYVLGTDGTIHRSQQVRYLPQRVNRPEGMETLGRAPARPRAHLENFLAGIRQGTPQNCPFEVGYRVSVACWMAAESLRLGRTVYWDGEKEEIL